MKRKTLIFTAPGRIEVREDSIAALDPDEVLIETSISAISAGSEMLVYRGQFPHDLAETHDTLSSNLSYPLTYGYASVGRVIEMGTAISREWMDRKVFGFQPHTSHFTAKPSTLLTIPENLPNDSAVFLPNMETAVNLVQDAAPILGENILVLGQGIIGLLVVSLLHQFPISLLITADKFLVRRQASLDIGGLKTYDPSISDWRDDALRQTAKDGGGFDLTIELSGNPAALDDAVSLTRFSGRIILGSWYGGTRAALDLGGSFHRSRLKLISSQVSTIAPELSSRWDKPRRFNVAWNSLRQIKPEKWITHRFPFDRAAEAYALLEQSAEQTIQVIFEYPPV